MIIPRYDITFIYIDMTFDILLIWSGRLQLDVCCCRAFWEAWTLKDCLSQFIMSSTGFLCGTGGEYSCLTANFSSIIYSNYASDLKYLTLPWIKDTVAPINSHFSFYAFISQEIPSAMLNDKDLNNSSKDLTVCCYTNKIGGCNGFWKDYPLILIGSRKKRHHLTSSQFFLRLNIWYFLRCDQKRS